MLTCWLIYGNYHIKRTQNRVTITYGLVSIKQININIDRIHGIFINQGLINRFLGFGSVSLSVVGLVSTSTNDNQQNAQQTGSSATILPFSKMTKIMEYLQEYFSELLECSEKHITKPSKESKLHYMVIPSCIIFIISLMILLPLAIYISPLFLLIDAPILIIFILNNYLRYRHSSIMVSKKITYITYGGLYYRRVWCQNHSIQEFRTKAGCIRKKQNLATVRVVLRGLMMPISVPHVQAFDYLDAGKHI